MPVRERLAGSIGRLAAATLPLLLLCGYPMGGAVRDAAEKEARLLEGTRQLTFEGRRSGEGYFSRDGSLMVFQSEREPGNPFYQIYLLDLETGDTLRVSPGIGKTTCGWIHPDGERVLFASTHDDPQAEEKQKRELEFRASGKERRYSWDYDEHYEIYSADRDGGNLKRLTRARGYDAEGSYSPDGRKIVFASNRHVYQGELSEKDRETFKLDKSFLIDLYVMDADGGNVRRLTDARGYDGGPFYSPDGKRICWRRFSEDGATAEIHIMDADGGNPRAVTRMGAMSWAPFFHPSGRYLIFATNKHGFGNFELYMVDSSGERDPVRVTYTDGFDGLPAFSPDGNRLAWTSNRTPQDQSQIFIAKWNHAEALSLLGLEGEPGGKDAKPPLPATASGVQAGDLRSHVAYLASDALGGRLTGSEGERRAAEYLAAYFESLGLQPAGDDGYYQDFEFTSGVSLGEGNELAITIGDETRSPTVDSEWRPLAFSKAGEVEPSEIVFAGYGIVAPADQVQEEYDSYAHLDVEGKWVLMLRYLPEDVSAERRQHLARHASLRYKAMLARDRGAKGILVASGPAAEVKEQLVELGFDASLSGTSVAAISIADRWARQLVSAAGKDLGELHKRLDKGEMVMGFPIPDASLAANIALDYETSVGRNVLARLPAGEGTSSQGAIAIGAHYDHLGRGEASGSLAKGDEKGQIHNGADDNASGVAGLLEIAEYLSGQRSSGRLKLRRDVLFAAWSGEELGLLGSSHFATQADGDNDGDLDPEIMAYLNLDMIGRLRDSLIVQGLGSSTAWAGIVERRNVPVGLALSTQKDSYLPTDATSFYLKKVPVLSAFTGAHEEYHSPRDTADLLNYDGAEDVSRFMALVARELATRPDPLDYVAMKKPEEKGRRAGLRAYLGTIPDYAQGDAPGLRLSGVAQGGPADKAGLQAGDVIVELAGRKVENIYDYTYAIDALKIGEAVDVIILRGGERTTLQITPASRD